MTRLPRVLDGLRADGVPLSLQEHLHRHGPLPRRVSGAAVTELAAAAGLLGRGGAGFPTATKLRTVAGKRGRKVVVANGVEAEPPSGKDKVLLRYTPHLVLDGLALAAAAVDAEDAVVAVSEAAAGELAAVREAVRERGGDPVGEGVRLHLIAVPDTFVAGEERALVNAISGGPPAPTAARPFERGVNGAPTLVQNVETLAHLALIARHGADWFRELGTRDEPGSALVTLSGDVRRPGVYEIALGSPLRDLVEQAGGTSAPPRAVLVGGYFGSWLDAPTAFASSLSDASLGAAGGSLGARAIIVLPEGACAVSEVARVARMLADESAGQCGPCVHGLASVAGAAASLLEGARPDDDLRIRRWLEQIHGRGGCRHPDGAVNFVASALEVFADEVSLHARGHRCAGRDLGLLPVRRRRERRAA